VTTMMLPAVIVVGSLVLTRRGFLLITGLTVLSAVGLVVADIQGILHTPYHDIARYRDAIAPALYLLFTAFLVRLLAADLVRGRDQARQDHRALAAANDQLERQAAALEQSEARWRTYIEQASDLVFILNPEGRLALVNDAVCRTFGYDAKEMLGRSPLDFVVDEAREGARAALQRILSGGAVAEFNVPVRTRDGRVLTIEARGHTFREQDRVVSTVHIARDVTARTALEEERRRLDARVQATQRVEGLGMLAGGIAHDFNNLLMAILGNIDLAKEDLAPGTAVWQPLQEAENAARRAAELTRQMLAYSGRATVLVQEVDLTQAVRSMSEMLRVSATERVTLAFELAEGLPRVRADVSQLRQVLVNLVMNASEAIGEAGGGRVVVSTAAVECTAEELSSTWLHDDLPAGVYVALQVKDDGAGMPPETLQRIFDPFFTTKFTGRGLGLAAVLGIVRSHRGAIAVDSAPGRGTTVRILLPAA
jgi:PAS domain S-box-containing protein